MRVLMLGWEYPPHIAGGLGVACEGLTRALSKRGVDVSFVVPKLFGGESAGHMTISDPTSLVRVNQLTEEAHLHSQGDDEGSRGAQLGVTRIPASLNPYVTSREKETATTSALSNPHELLQFARTLAPVEDDANGDEGHYGSGIFGEVLRYTRKIIQATRGMQFDVIHAHDWMTYPAGVGIALMTGKPLVVHLHSCEFDRSGSGRNQFIYDIERMGLQQADKVFAVSAYTRHVVSREYDVPLEKIQVVYNGIDPGQRVEKIRSSVPQTLRLSSSKTIKSQSKKRVLFLGRITMQKGPEYFMHAARMVLDKYKDVEFQVAGSGDMLSRMIDLSYELKISDHVHFLGFLRGEAVTKAYCEADLYVMPSVSEPFGISALEAVKSSTPLIVSKQAGVAEVLKNALRCDFWDVRRLADLMLNVLLSDGLANDLSDFAFGELGGINWQKSASIVTDVYREVRRV